MTTHLTGPMCRLLDGANFGALATLMADGSPKVEPVWVGRDDAQVMIATDRNSIKARNMERDGRVALSVTDRDNPYEQLLIRGRIIDIRDDGDLAALDTLSQVYLGKPFPRRRWSARAIYLIEPTVARYYRSPLEPPGADVDG